MINVMIAEDDIQQAQNFKEFLTNAGLTVVALTTTGEETIEEYISKQPDVLFLDLEMPNINGLEVLKFLKDKSCKKNIVITSHSQVLVSSLYDFSNVYWLMSKPFSYSKAIEVAKEIACTHDAVYIKNIIRNILSRLNFNLSSYGTSNFIDLIFIQYQRMPSKFSLKQLYSILAKQIGFTSAIQIKWSIENSLSSAKKYMNKEVLYSIFDDYNDSFTLTQSYLLYLIVDYLELTENNK